MRERDRERRKLGDLRSGAFDLGLWVAEISGYVSLQKAWTEYFCGLPLPSTYVFIKSQSFSPVCEATKTRSDALTAAALKSSLLV